MLLASISQSTSACLQNELENAIYGIAHILLFSAIYSSGHIFIFTFVMLSNNM